MPLQNRIELDVIAAGFAGGQVRWQHSSLSLFPSCGLLTNKKVKLGVDVGPAAILDAGLLDQLKQDLGLSVHFNNQVHSYSDITPQVNLPYHSMNHRTVSAATQKLSAQDDVF
jgi:hypothetical protein